MVDEAPEQAVSRVQLLPTSWKVAFSAYFATRVPMVLFAWLVEHFRPHRLRDGHFLFHGGASHDLWLVDVFQKWDSYWFLNIVREGYQFFGPIEQVSNVVAGQAETNVTPFPLYPFLMEVGSWITGDPSVAGFLVAQICLILAMVLLYHLVALDADGKSTELAVWFFAIIPWTYAFSAIYSESLFFMLTLGGILAVRRGHVALGSISGMLAALTRLPGVLIVIPMFFEVVASCRETGEEGRGGFNLGRLLPRLFLLALVPMGTILYFVYLWWLTGEPFAYFVGQQGWHKELVGLWYHPGLWLTSTELEPEDTLHMASAAFMLAILVLGWRRLRWSYWIYATVAFAVLMSSSNLLGLPRYASSLFPIYIVMANFAGRHELAGRALQLSSAMVAMAVFWVWMTWRYAF